MQNIRVESLFSVNFSFEFGVKSFFEPLEFEGGDVREDFRDWGFFGLEFGEDVSFDVRQSFVLLVVLLIFLPRLVSELLVLLLCLLSEF